MEETEGERTLKEQATDGEGRMVMIRSDEADSDKHGQWKNAEYGSKFKGKVPIVAIAQ